MGAFVDGGVTCTQTITSSDIRAYAEMSGDRNPIHLGDDAIAHGALILGKISAAVWRAYGDGTIARGIESMKLHRAIKADESFNVFIGRAVDVPDSRLGEKTAIARVTKLCGEREKLIAEATLLIIPPENGNGLFNDGGA